MSLVLAAGGRALPGVVPRMSWEAWLTLAVIACVFVGMAKNWGSPDVMLLAGTVALTAAGVIGPREAFRGFSNEAMLTVGALFVVVAAMRETGGLTALGQRMLGRGKNPRVAMARMAGSVTTMSAFLNNTPIVAMMLPIVTEWCRKRQISPSKLLIPLSFLTVLGGMCTLIGTSTNLVIQGFLQRAGAEATDPALQVALRPMGVFEMAPLGLACAGVGALYLLTIGYRLLPDRREAFEQLGETSREYLVELEVQAGCRLVGQTVEAAGLRHLPGLFLIEIARAHRLVSPVGPDEPIRERDRLLFTGVVASIVDLEQIPGLVPVDTDGYEGEGERRQRRRLCEAVISASSPLIGKTIRDADFRALYNAAVIAVHRGGQRLGGRVGDIDLRAGDTLLLQTGAHFARAHRNNADFVLVSSVEESRPIRHHRARLALGILAFMILVMTFSDMLGVEIVVVVFLAALLLIATRCISSSDALESVDWQTLIGIAASFGLGAALEKSGAAKVIADFVVSAAGSWGGPIAVLAAIYLITMVFTELISNNAAAALMFPLATAAAASLDVSPRPFAIAIMFGATLAFATPIGYQTNLMVYGPGGYRFTDFTRVGLPLNLILWVLATALIPVFWPFR